MTPEETIALIEGVAMGIPGIDVQGFAARARADLNVYRQELLESPFDERSERGRDEPRPARPAAPFSVPERYDSDPETWIVFSAFLACFVDPIACAVHVAEGMPDPESRTGRVVRTVCLADDLPPEAAGEELDRHDVERLQNDLTEIRQLSEYLGFALLGERFRPQDFFGDRDQRG